MKLFIKKPVWLTERDQKSFSCIHHTTHTIQEDAISHNLGSNQIIGFD